MAEVNTATSSHLDSYMHVYDNGSTARLYVTPWTKDTVADGYWQTINTIQPLINRDIYLADAIDKLANKYTVYKPGFGIEMTQDTVNDTWTISVNAEDILGAVPKYEFDEKYFSSGYTPDVENGVTIGIKIKDEYIKADSNGLFCNIDYMLSSTSSYSSYSSVSSHTTSSFTYNYEVASAQFIATANLPDNPDTNKIYLIG